jgi:hypothetical protein
MSKRMRASAYGCLFLGLAALALRGVPGIQEGDLELVKKLTVPGNAGWVDTGLDAAQGDAFHFKASGEISLQKGNPAANCGPAGLDLVTTQQPVPDRNIGALIGKVAQLIDVKKDEDTGEEIRDEIVRTFFVGEAADLTAPIRGRLYLGVNENIFKDNGGEFTVLIYRRKG